MAEDQGVSAPHPARWGVLYRSSGPFWDAVAEHRLCLQRCAGCQRWLVPPRPMCPGCLSAESEWVPVAGTGTIASWVTYATSPHPAFPDGHTVVLVELDEGPRLVSTVVGIPASDLAVGMPVRVTYEDVEDDFTLFTFERAA